MGVTGDKINGAVGKVHTNSIGRNIFPPALSGFGVINPGTGK